MSTDVTPELVADARRGKQQAAVELMSMFYPSVYRMAHSLAGREDVGDGVVQFVMKRSLRAMENWDAEDKPARWYHHHTLLTARRASKHQAQLAGDPLIARANTADAYYPAFVRALRVLPSQQREAFLLHHGERWNVRSLAIAMDCSTEAANNHLRQASGALMQLAGDMFPVFTAQVAQAYRRLTPSGDLVMTNVRMRVRRYVVPKRIANVGRLLFLLVTVALIALAAWKLRTMKLVY